MAVATGNGTPLTSTVEGDGSQTATFELPLQGKLIVSSVVASIETGGSNAAPVLTMLDKSGEVIAKKPQPDTLDASSDGTATWALRLADESPGGTLEVTDGVTTIDPTAELLIGSGLTLTSPSAGVAQLDAAGGGSYVLVSEQVPAAGNILFSAIPQNARHLVLFLWFRFASQVPIITFNADGAAHYKTLYQIVQDLNGAVTDVSSSTTPTQNGIYLEGMDGEYPSKAVITIPYYRFLSGTGPHDRSLICDSVAQTDDPSSATELIRRTNLAGWWAGAGGSGAAAINSIKISVAGAQAIASLYKVI